MNQVKMAGRVACKRFLSLYTSTLSARSASGWLCAGPSQAVREAPVQPSRCYASKKYVPETIDYSRTVPGYEDIVKDAKEEESVIPKLYSLEYADMMAKHKCDIKDIMDLMKKRDGDTGSSAVQIGTLSVRIKYLTDHMRTNRKDKHCLRSLIKLVHRRQKVMRYLKRKDIVLYHNAVSDLAIRPLQNKKYLQKK